MGRLGTLGKTPVTVKNKREHMLTCLTARHICCSLAQLFHSLRIFLPSRCPSFLLTLPSIVQSHVADALFIFSTLPCPSTWWLDNTGTFPLPGEREIGGKQWVRACVWAWVAESPMSCNVAPINEMFLPCSSINKIITNSMYLQEKYSSTELWHVLPFAPSLSPSNFTLSPYCCD